ncbi:zinc ribbon domain-containing protein [Chloroflexota bacterium]
MGIHDKGLTMPVIIDPERWQAAQEKRTVVRSIHRETKNWLLQGICICGECGRVFNCRQPNPNQLRRYICRGRNKDSHLDGSPKCTMRSIEAGELEKAVWRQLKAVMTNQETLKESVRHSLEEARQRRNNLDNRRGTSEKELQEVYDKKERLALVYADRAIKRETYEKRMSVLMKRENDLLKARSNLNPQVIIELDELERTISYLDKAIEGKEGKLSLTEMGIWVDNIPDSWIGGYRVSSIGSWDEPNTFDIGEFKLGEKGPVMRMVDGPPQSNAEASRKTVLQNIRRVFELLQIRVYVFRDKIEMKGFIPKGSIGIPYEDDDEEKDSIILSS